MLLPKKTEIKSLLKEYLKFGGFPEVVLTNENLKKAILLTYFDDIITKDTVERYKIRISEKLKTLANFISLTFLPLSHSLRLRNFLT